MRRVLLRFSDEYGYSPLIWHENSTSDGFLKVHWSVESETVSISFAYPATSISIWPVLQFEWTFHPPDSSFGKEPACDAGGPSSIPRSGRSAGEGTGYPLQYSWASLAAQLVKNPPAMQETWVWSLGWEDPLEKEKYTHSSILAWRIPWTVSSMGSQRVAHGWATFTLTPHIILQHDTSSVVWQKYQLNEIAKIPQMSVHFTSPSLSSEKYLSRESC